jgi:hypothetical protein
MESSEALAVEQEQGDGQDPGEPTSAAEVVELAKPAGRKVKPFKVPLIPVKWLVKLDRWGPDEWRKWGPTLAESLIRQRAEVASLAGAAFSLAIRALMDELVSAINAGASRRVVSIAFTLGTLTSKVLPSQIEVSGTVEHKEVPIVDFPDDLKAALVEAWERDKAERAGGAEPLALPAPGEGEE